MSIDPSRERLQRHQMVAPVHRLEDFAASQDELLSNGGNASWSMCEEV